MTSYVTPEHYYNMKLCAGKVLVIITLAHKVIQSNGCTDVLARDF